MGIALLGKLFPKPGQIWERRKAIKQIGREENTKREGQGIGEE